MSEETIVLASDFDWKRPDYTAIYAHRTAMIKRLRDNPSLVPAIKEFYKTHPVEFINDYGMTFDPRNVEIGIPSIVPFILFEKQKEFIQFLYDHWRGRKDALAEKSRDMGVSWLCVAFGAWMWLFHPGTVVGFGSRKEEYVDKLGDPKSLLWKIREFIKLLPVEFRPVGFIEQKHAPFMRIVNPHNGSTIIGEAGDNIGRGNRTSIYFKDESAFYERAEAIDAALSQTSNCKIDVSTPNGAGNAFYRKRHSGKIDVFVFDWRDDPRKNQQWYEKQCQDLDPVIVAQEIDRNYEASVTNSWIDGESVRAAMARGPFDVEAVGALQMGIDVARMGDDKTVFTFRRGRVVYPQIVIVKSTIDDVVGRAIDEIEARGIGTVMQIAVDDIGLGGGVTDYLRKKYGAKVVGVNSSLRLNDGRNYNLRSRIWRDMRTYIQTGAALPNDPELQADLTALRYHYKDGLMLMESKDLAKARGIKSPDRSDSLALTFAYPVVDYVGQSAQRAQAIMD